MDFKKEIKKMVDHLKELGVSRPEIERETKNSEGWIATTLSRGGNEKAYTTIKMYYDLRLRKSMPDDVIRQTANSNEYTQIVTEDIIRLKASDKVLRLWVCEIASLLKKTSYASETALLEADVQAEVIRLFEKRKNLK